MPKLLFGHVRSGNSVFHLVRRPDAKQSFVGAETLAQRIRDALARKKNIEERKMFGCICLLLNENVLAGVWKDSLIARFGPDQGEDALLEPHVKVFNITGKPMKNWILVQPEGVVDDDQLKDWIQRAAKFVGKLPGK